MEIKIPFNYIFLSGIINRFKYSTSKELEKDLLIDYAIKFIRNVKKDFYLSSRVNLTFNDFDIEEELESFLEKEKDLLFMDDETEIIKIDDEVEYDDLEDELINITEEEELDYAFELPTDTLDLLRIINSTYIYDEYTKIIKSEINLEASYLNNMSEHTQETEKLLDKKFFLKSTTMFNIKQLSDVTIEALRDTAVEMAYNDDSEPYKQYPIDLELCGEIDSSIIDTSNSFFYKLYPFAIFGETLLSYKKLEDELNNLFCQECLDGEIKFNNSTEQIIQISFYSKYLKNIDEFQSKNPKDSDLVESKERLLYALDNSNVLIYKNNHYEQIVEDEKDMTFSPILFKQEKQMANYFIHELFLGENITNISRKLLFIKTYLEITNDLEIRETFDSYSAHPLYKSYSNAVLTKNKTKKLE